MKVQWELNDHYVGKSRPHYVEIDDDELNDCETEEERNQLIEECVRDDFDQIGFYWEKA